MLCARIDQAEIAKTRTELETMKRYIPREQRLMRLQFRFSLDPSQVGESVFVVLSNRAHAVVYRGPYKPEITVDFDKKLASNGGGDNLEFWLLEIGNRRRCIWINEDNAYYWRPGAKIRIQFLEERVFDEAGLSKRFNITFE